MRQELPPVERDTAGHPGAIPSINPKPVHFMPSTFGPYTPVRQAGDLYFTAGQVGADAATKTAPTSITEQTAAAIDNLANVLDTADLALSDVVKTTVYLVSMDDYAAMNEAYLERFPAPRPARSAVAVAELPRVANVPRLVEIEAVAARSRS
jgi:2-iminobutanoate/2-iminopropanoate deaminase